MPTAHCRLPTANCRQLRSALQIPDKPSPPKKIYKTNPLSNLQKGTLSFSTLSQHSAMPTAHCRLPTIFTQHSALRSSTANCRLFPSALQIPDKLSRPKKIYKTNPFSYLQKGVPSLSTSAKPTANYLHSALSTQHSALRSSTADCQLFSFSVLRTQHFLSFPSTDFIAHCRLPTLFIFAQHSAPSTQHYAFRLPTANCLHSAPSTQHSALRSSAAHYSFAFSKKSTIQKSYIIINFM